MDDPELASLFGANDDHERFMRVALREAELAAAEGEVPVGAVIVKNGRIIGRGRNQRETLKDPTAHAEMIAITQAASALESWRLLDAVMYVTLEPCAMCAGAIVLARLPRVVFGAADPKAGACGSLMNITQDARLNHRVELVPGVLADDCGGILKDFFAHVANAAEVRALLRSKRKTVRRGTLKRAIRALRIALASPGAVSVLDGHGGVPERSNGPVSKTGVPLNGYLGFKSLLLR